MNTLKNTALITGANRGIGLEFVRHYLSQGWQVAATCRDLKATKALNALKSQGDLSVFSMDTIDIDSIGIVVQALSNKPIDHLINVAGYYGEKNESLGSITPENLRNTFDTNVVGTLNVCQAFLPNVALSREKLVITLSSKMGSISDNASGGAYSYRASKAALNIVMKSLAIDCKPRDIKVLILHPGWVKTRMGGENALISVEKSVSGMIEVIHAKGPTAHALFCDYNGCEIMW